MFLDIEDLGQLLRQHSVKAGAAGAAPAAQPAAGEEQAIAPRASPQPERQMPDKEMTVYIGGAPTQITTSFFYAGDLADTFKIDTTKIPKFNWNAKIAKIVNGPPDLQGKWECCSVMQAFDPTRWKVKKTALNALASNKLSIEKYPSRTEVKIAHHNVSLPNFLYHSY